MKCVTSYTLVAGSDWVVLVFSWRIYTGLMSGSQWGVQASFPRTNQRGMFPGGVSALAPQRWIEASARSFAFKRAAYIYFGGNSRGKWVRSPRDSLSLRSHRARTPKHREKRRQSSHSPFRAVNPAAEPSKRTLLIWASAELGHSPDEGWK